MQSLECVELLLFVLLPKMSVPDIKNLRLCILFSPGDPTLVDVNLNIRSVGPISEQDMVRPRI